VGKNRSLEGGLKRTQQQNNAMHKYFEMLAEALNDAGYSMSAALQKMEIDVPWTKENVKKIIWHEIEQAMLNKDSTAELETPEVDRVYQVVDRFTSERFGVHCPFPKWENMPDD
jgi:3-oxoacyl-[acyl-carrier-protein] synthase III